MQVIEKLPVTERTHFKFKKIASKISILKSYLEWSDKFVTVT